MFSQNYRFCEIIFYITFHFPILRIRTAFRDFDFSGNAKAEEEPFNPFHFTELRVFCTRLVITAAIMFAIGTLFHFWLQFIVIIIMFYFLQWSENCLHQASQELSKGADDISRTVTYQMSIYSFTGLICSYISLHTLFATLNESDSFFGAIVNACLLSMFVFLLFGSMKHIAFCFHFFRGCDVENGALSLLTMVSIIIRFIFVTPIWVCFLSDSPPTKYPETFNSICIVYILGKIICLWILCVDFQKGCACFFRSVYLRSPDGQKCEMCKDETPAVFTTQCGHSFCKKCIDKARKVDASCPICSFSIPRKWTMPFKYGNISTIVLACIL